MGSCANCSRAQRTKSPCSTARAGRKEALLNTLSATFRISAKSYAIYGVDAVIHLAAIHNPNIAPTKVTYQTNVAGTFEPGVVRESNYDDQGVGRVEILRSTKSTLWNEAWQTSIAKHLRLESTLRARGPPARALYEIGLIPFSRLRAPEATYRPHSRAQMDRASLILPLDLQDS